MPDYATVTLTSPSMTATFVPSAGMIGTSFAEGDLEFLGQRRGLEAYVSDGKTMGIPILYPWANRLSGPDYTVDGRVVTLTAGEHGVRTDANGAPMHGVLAANPDWVVTAQADDGVTAVLAYDSPELLASFPFPHKLTQTVTLRDRTLTVETTVAPTTEIAVPLCYGYHPYVRIPGVPRDEWSLSTPTMRHLLVDERGLPTGERESRPSRTESLQGIEYDDGFDEVAAGSVFALNGGDRRIEVTFDTGYPCAQLFAPASDDLIGIEPMTAPTDALRRGGYRVATRDAPDTARFSITVY